MTDRLPAIGAGLALALLLTACGGGGDSDLTSARATRTLEASTAGAEATARPSETALEKTHNAADVTFAQMMIVHHEGAIEMADLAVLQADADEVRTLAGRVADAQGPEIEEMASWLEAWGEDIAPMGGMEGMDHGGMDMGGMDQEAAMAELGALSGGAFDRRFLDLMIAHHAGAIEMAQAELDDGENVRALELARTIVLDQEMEIVEMEELRGSL